MAHGGASGGGIPHGAAQYDLLIKLVLLGRERSMRERMLDALPSAWTCEHGGSDRLHRARLAPCGRERIGRHRNADLRTRRARMKRHH